MSDKTVARETYRQKREDITRLIDWLEIELASHEILAGQEPNWVDWDHVVDISKVWGFLILAVSGLGGRSPKEIENLLNDC